MKDPKIPPSMMIDGKPLRFCDVIRAKNLLRDVDVYTSAWNEGAPMVNMSYTVYEELCKIFNVRL